MTFDGQKLRSGAFRVHSSSEPISEGLLDKPQTALANKVRKMIKYVSMSSWIKHSD